MKDGFLNTQSLPDFALWEKKKAKNALFSFTLELTARCNNDCRHCYINLPVGDLEAKNHELTFDEIRNIVDQAVDLGAVWCLITGGEPLLRDDFEEIYLYLKKKGLLVTVFTNGTLITQKHVELFKKYPPRDLEITVYGVTAKTYAAVTRKPALFDAFMNGVNLLIENDIRVSLKNVTIRANLYEFDIIAAFCRKYSRAPFRFDPLIHLRYDRDEDRNREIRSQRLSPEEIAALERSDEARYNAMKKNCDKLILPPRPESKSAYMFGCGAGMSDFVVSPNGYYRLCSSLWHPDCLEDLREKSVKEIRKNMLPKVRSMQSSSAEFIKHCAFCTLVNLCIWCPAHAWLESGKMDAPSDYFCSLAEQRSKNIHN